MEKKYLFRKDQVRAERNRRGWSQGEFMQNTGFTRSKCQLFEDDRRHYEPRFTDVAKLADLFDMEMEEFLLKK